MKPALRRLSLLLLVAGAFAAGALLAPRLFPTGGSGARGPLAPVRAAGYYCPMHPTYVSDRPGDCPICGMRLARIESTPAPAGGARGAGGGADVPSAPAPGAGAGPVTDRTTIHVPARKQELIGVRTGVVRRLPLRRSLRAPAVIAADETRLHHIHSKAEGWIEKLYVSAAGEHVRRGQPLFDLYSPALLAAQEEHLIALRARAAAPSRDEAAGMAEALLESSRRRLLLLDLTPAQVDALEASGQPQRVVTFQAPVTGYVIGREVAPGERIEAGTTLLDVADLSRVWVIASLYENDLPFVHAGQTGTVSLDYLPGRTFEGRVTLVAPVVDETTRTVKVRLEFANPGGALKPGMFAEAVLEADLGARLQVPESAVLSSGVRDLVFVARADGGFEPRAVRLGVRTSDAVEILAGLEEGEAIVVSGTFLIDAESRLKAGLEAAGAPPAAHEGHP
jgi:membrane fusion protein, copper/silver efflux system